MGNLGKRFKAWVVDFDGTLVDRTFSLSQRVKSAILKTVDEGFVFCIASGRPYKGIVKKVCKDLKLASPQIVSGGSKILNPKTEEILWMEYFPRKTAEKIIGSFIDNNYDFSVESDDYVFTLNGVSKEQEYGPGSIFKDVKYINYSRVSKMVLMDVGLIDDPEKMQERLGSQYPDLHFIRSGVKRIVLDITSAKATKHLAVLELSKILNIDPSFMIGVGDGYNDYPLLSVCGYKVAMVNAPQQLKDIADLIVPDVANDGLAVAINKLAN